MTLPYSIRPATRQDVENISKLHGHAFGPGRFARTAYRIREGKGQISRFCLVAEREGKLVGSIRMTEVTVGGVGGAALLGPVVVAPEWRGTGLGTQLIDSAIDAARTAHVALLILVGDEPFYGRFGFQPAKPGTITLPGPVNPERILTAELTPGVRDNYCGLVVAVPATELTLEESILAQL